MTDDINKIASEFLRSHLLGKPAPVVYHVEKKQPTCYGEDASAFLKRMRKELERRTMPQELTERIDVDDPSDETVLTSNGQFFIGFLTSPNGKRRPVFSHNFKLAKVFTKELDLSFAQIELLTFDIGAERMSKETMDVITFSKNLGGNHETNIQTKSENYSQTAS